MCKMYMKVISFTSSVMGEENLSSSAGGLCLFISIIYTCMYKTGHVTRGERKRARTGRTRNSGAGEVLRA